MRITDIQPQKNHKDRFSVYIDEEFAFGIDGFDLLRLRLKPGGEITQEELSEIKDEVVYEKAKSYSVKILNGCAYTENTLRSKLSERGCDNEAIDRVLSYLKEYNYINDEEYAARYVEECVSGNKCGRYMIAERLRQRGVGEEAARAAMSEYDFDEIEAEGLVPLMKKKLGGDLEYKNLARVKKYFASRGYGFSAISRAEAELLRQEGEENDA